MVVLLGLASLLVIPIKLGFSLEHQDSVTDLRLIAGLIGPLQFSVRLPMDPLSKLANPAQPEAESGKQAENGEQTERVEQTLSGKASKGDKKGMSGGRSLFLTSLRVAKLFTATVRRVERLTWRTVVGTGDAAATSYVTGSLWTFKSILIGWLRRHYTFLTAPVCNVVPDFDRSCLALEVSCIFRFTIGEIIVAVVSQHFTHRTRG